MRLLLPMFGLALLGCHLLLPLAASDGRADVAGLDGRGGDASARAPDAIPGAQARVSAASFLMGSPANELCRAANETQHQVTLTRSFEIMTREVSQAQYLALLGENPSLYARTGSCVADGCPVESLSWHNAAAFCNALSARAGRPPCYQCTGTGSQTSCQEAVGFTGPAIYQCPGHRLPTEAEWELAYRAGTTTALYNGPITSCKQDPNADLIAHYAFLGGASTRPGGQKAPNSLGLRDMAGNVWEWCHDRYVDDLGGAASTDPWGAASGEQRTLRGGAFGDDASFLRAARRSSASQDDVDDSIGFRCVRTLP